VYRPGPVAFTKPLAPALSARPRFFISLLIDYLCGCEMQGEESALPIAYFRRAAECQLFQTGDYITGLQNLAESSNCWRVASRRNHLPLWSQHSISLVGVVGLFQSFAQMCCV
jgi:hypothetical protein